MTNKNNANRNDEQPLLNVLRTESFRAQLDAIVKDGLDSLDVVRLDSGLNRGLNFLEVGSIAARAFASSPLQNMNMEAEVLVEILINAHERKVPIAEAYVEVTSNTGEEYIAFCEKKHGHAFQSFFRYEQDNPNRIYPSEELAAWMTQRLDALGYSPTE